ncbi:MAG: insulinase family protein [Kiritimatiellae bacterium]|nr:insulinase family protein [Kiritimatiellia bacterium]
MKLNVNKTTLPNGIRVVSASMPHVESVAMGVWVGVGGRYEPKAISGMSHFIEHLLFKGTKKRSAQEISQAIEGRGGYFNAFTQEESTCYYARITSDHAWNTLDILCDMYLNARFDKVDIDKERGVIIEEIIMYADQPHHLVQDILGELLWANHALGRPLIGTPENIRRVTRKEILDFKNKKYVSNNTVITFAGKIDHAACVHQVAKRLGSIKKRTKPSFTRVTSKTVQKRVAVASKEIEQSHLAIGVKLFGRKDPRRFAAKLLSIILGENMSSRLFQIVREKYGLAYSIHSSVQLFDDTGVFIISVGLDRLQTDKAIALIFKELNRIKEKPVSKSELKRAKDYTIGQMQIGLESTAHQMMWIGENMMSYGECIQPSELIQRIETITSEHILKLAKQLFKRHRISIALVTPLEDSDRSRDVSFNGMKALS